MPIFDLRFSIVQARVAVAVLKEKAIAIVNIARVIATVEYLFALRQL